jgi:hypothetical protein
MCIDIQDIVGKPFPYFYSPKKGRLLTSLDNYLSLGGLLSRLGPEGLPVFEGQPAD